MYGACVYDAANFVTDEQTDGQGDSRSRISKSNTPPIIIVNVMITGDGIVVSGLVVVVLFPCSKLVVVSSTVVIVADFVVDTTSLVVVVISIVVVTIGASVTFGGDCGHYYWMAVIV